MIKEIKKILFHQFQFFFPKYYKRKFFRDLENLTSKNILNKKIEPEFLFFSKKLSPDDVFLDIGANNGAYIYLAEKVLNPNNIFAFEPNDDLYQRLLRLFSCVKIQKIALSDKNQMLEFKIPVIGGREVHTRGTLQVDYKEIGENQSIIKKVKAQTLDSWVEENPLHRLDFIKIDVEGNEQKTLRGAKNTILKYRPWLMVEIEKRHHRFPIWQIVEEVCQWGYEPYFFSRETFEIELLTAHFLESQNEKNIKNYKDYINNIIFKPKSI